MFNGTLKRLPIKLLILKLQIVMLGIINFSFFYLKLTKVPYFQKSIVPSRQDEWFAPVPADHVDVGRVSAVG